MIGTTISHYHVLEKLGGGGMGVVYKAEDTKLKRFVALKFLPPDLTRDDEAKQRFVHEAQAASALQHDNICTVHGIDETDDGQLFICMDFYSGETLKQKIERGPLPVEEAVGLARQIANGLARAHVAGMIHRDIKPANIMVTKEGEAKILDFGLAKLARQTKLTRTGLTPGTAAYMSPEQAEGRSVDHRTDLWSLGVTLYEMVTGKRPFDSEYEQALLYLILNDDPKPIRSVRPDAPASIEKISARALMKEPKNRYQTAVELIGDLEACKAGTEMSSKTKQVSSRNRRLFYAGLVTIALPVALFVTLYFAGRRNVLDRVAVIPFHNLSRDSTAEILADGMPWEITEKLQHVGSLNVASAKATMKFKGSKATYEEIAHELGAKALVHGSIFRVNDRVQVTASLIDPQTDRSLWSESYDSPIEDILNLQSRIAQGLVRAVRVEVTHDEETRLGQSRRVDPRAYELYLRSRQTFYNVAADEHQHRSALRALEQAIAIDSTYPPFYPLMVMMYQYGTFFGYYRHAEAIPRMQKAVESALVLDPQSSNSLMALGILDEAKWDWDGAEAAFARALETSPGDAEIHQAYSNMLQWLGRFDEAIARMNRACQIDPSIDPHGLWTAATYVNAKRFDGAIRLAQDFLRRFPDDPVLHLILGFGYAQKGMCDSAAGPLERSLQLSGHDKWVEVNCAQMYGICGERQKARDLLHHYLAVGKGWVVEPYNVAATYAILHDTVNAYLWLERAYRDRSQSLNGLKIDVAWDRQHESPRYRDMLKRLRLDK